MNAERMDHRADFRSRDHIIDILHAVCLELVEFRLEFLRGAGHDRNNDDIFTPHIQNRRERLFGDASEHLLRRTAGGEIFVEFREIRLRILDPAGAAAREHRERTTRFHTAQKLLGFLDNRHIRRKRGIVNIVKPHQAERRNQFARKVFAGRHIEVFADADTDRPGQLSDN